MIKTQPDTTKLVYYNTNIAVPTLGFLQNNIKIRYCAFNIILYRCLLIPLSTHNNNTIIYTSADVKIYIIL